MDEKPELLPGGSQVFTSPNHRVGSDALLLAEFVPLKPALSVCDLGAGCGVVLLSLLDRGLSGPAVAVELDAEGAALCRKAAIQNPYPNLDVVAGDLRAYRPKALFDLVVANPPYFSDGPLPQNRARAAARHETACTLTEVCAAAARLLKDGGRFCLCYPPGRLAALFAALHAQALEPKRLCFVRKAPEAAPWLALVDARKKGGETLTILPDRILPPGAPVVY